MTFKYLSTAIVCISGLKDSLIIAWCHQKINTRSIHNEKNIKKV